MRRDFDPDAFLRVPLVARLATSGPTVRPIWFLWEDAAFWWLIGPWSALERHLEVDPVVALVIDTCDVDSGEVKQVRARGVAEIRPLDRDRAYRKLSRYLGADASRWDDSRFRLDDDSAKFVRLAPEHLESLDLSFRPSRPPGG
jgi:hypothetical protein